MNRDVLYSVAIANIEKGATVTFSEITKGWYAFILVVDNDQYCPQDKTFTVHFGAADKCPKDAKNRLWTLPMAGIF